MKKQLITKVVSGENQKESAEFGLTANTVFLEKGNTFSLQDMYDHYQRFLNENAFRSYSPIDPTLSGQDKDGHIKIWYKTPYPWTYQWDNFNNLEPPSLEQDFQIGNGQTKDRGIDSIQIVAKNSANIPSRGCFVKGQLTADSLKLNENNTYDSYVLYDFTDNNIYLPTNSNEYKTASFKIFKNNQYEDLILENCNGPIIVQPIEKNEGWELKIDLKNIVEDGKEESLIIEKDLRKRDSVWEFVAITEYMLPKGVPSEESEYRLKLNLIFEPIGFTLKYKKNEAENFNDYILFENQDFDNAKINLENLQSIYPSTFDMTGYYKLIYTDKHFSFIK